MATYTRYATNEKAEVRFTTDTASIEEDRKNASPDVQAGTGINLSKYLLANFGLLSQSCTNIQTNVLISPAWLQMHIFGTSAGAISLLVTLVRAKYANAKLVAIAKSNIINPTFVLTALKLCFICQ